MATTTCSTCQTEVAQGTTYCPKCGAPMARTGSGGPGITFDAGALDRTDRIVSIATVVLFIALFLPWFSISFGLGTVSEDGLSAHGYLYLALFISLAIIGLMAAQALGLWNFPAGSTMSKDQLLVAGTGTNFVLVALAFLFKPGGIGSGVGWSLGAFLALAASVVALAPLAQPIIKARRAR